MFRFRYHRGFRHLQPRRRSYYHWIADKFPTFTVFKAFVGVVRLIGWTIFICATLGSLGFIGIILASAFFGLAIWLIIDVICLSADSQRVISYIVSMMPASVLSIGVSWSHIRLRLTGQIDTDGTERDDI